MQLNEAILRQFHTYSIKNYFHKSYDMAYD